LFVADDTVLVADGGLATELEARVAAAGQSVQHDDDAVLAASRTLAATRTRPAPPSRPTWYSASPYGTSHPTGHR
jgi:hypothetical protein